MNSIFKRAAVLVLGCMLVAGAGRAANEPSREAIKKLMGDNFQNVARILVELISARYENLPKEAETIAQHANRLMEAPPASLKTKQERDLFLSYATNLKISAEHLMVVTTELARRDQKTVSAGDMNVDYLRAVAAEHFGTVITNCVLCHNQFRRRAL